MNSQLTVFLFVLGHPRYSYSTHQATHLEVTLVTEGRRDGRRHGHRDGRRDGRHDGSRDGRLDRRRDGRLDSRRDGRRDGLRLRQTITIASTMVRLAPRTI